MNTFNQFGQPVGEPLIDWQPRQHPSRVVLQGRYCWLEPLQVEHAGALFAAYSLAGDTRSWTWQSRCGLRSLILRPGPRWEAWP